MIFFPIIEMMSVEPLLLSFFDGKTKKNKGNGRVKIYKK